MYQDRYYVPKYSGTYSDMLEAIGLSYFLKRLIKNEDNDIVIKDKGMYYEINLSEPIDEELINNVRYFDLFPYIKDKKGQDLDLINYIDYEEEKEKQKEYNDILSNAKGDKKEVIKKLEEVGLRIRDDWSLISCIKNLKALSTYQKLFLNIYNNKDNFSEMVKIILELYSTPLIDESIAIKKIKRLEKEKKLKSLNEVSSLQIINPDKVKGANNPKCRSMKSGSLKAFWIREYFKIGGIYHSMTVKNVKINNKTWDTKAYVFSINQIDINKIDIIYNQFSKKLKGMTSIKLDILSILYLCEMLIKYKEEYEIGKSNFRRRYNVKNYVYGFFTVYYKNMGNASSPTNISFLELPNFIEISSYQEGRNWLDILQEHISVINNIKIAVNKLEEMGSVLELLKTYRIFLTTSDLNIFLDFLVNYAVFLMQQIDKQNFYVKPFTSKIMEVFFVSIDKNYKAVLENQGFKNIAKAIRNSTILAQYRKNNNDKVKYPIRYGLAQDIKRKAPYKDELIEYISDFITWYNKETARVAEKHPELLKEGKIRATVKYQDIEDFISLLEDSKFDSNVIGKLLCAYGYSLDRKNENESN